MSKETGKPAAAWLQTIASQVLACITSRDIGAMHDLFGQLGGVNAAIVSCYLTQLACLTPPEKVEEEDQEFLRASHDFVSYLSRLSDDLEVKVEEMLPRIRYVKPEEN